MVALVFSLGDCCSEDVEFLFQTGVFPPVALGSRVAFSAVTTVAAIGRSCHFAQQVRRQMAEPQQAISGLRILAVSRQPIVPQQRE